MTLKTRLIPIVFATLLLGLGTVVRADDVRFSRTLTQPELTSLGLVRLSSDQLAVLDALIRRDIERSHYVSKVPRAARFSQRLSADERRNAGLGLLNETELAQLDAAVERAINPPDAGPAFSLATAGSGAPVQSFKISRGPQIHGSMELMVGAGSHGYSEYGGALMVTVEDPASHLMVAIGYSELHSKGGYLYRGCHDTFRGPGDLLW